MNRVQLLAAQLVVALVLIAAWQFATTVPVNHDNGATLLPKFFFSTPLDVANRIVKWLVEGTIWRHLAITLTEVDPRLRDRLAQRRADRLLVRAPADGR